MVVSELCEFLLCIVYVVSTVLGILCLDCSCPEDLLTELHLCF